MGNRWGLQRIDSSYAMESDGDCNGQQYCNGEVVGIALPD